MSPQDKDKYQTLASLHNLPDAALITKSDLAALLSMSARGIEKLMRESVAPQRYNMPNRLLRWRMKDVREWMQNRQNQAGTAA